MKKIFQKYKELIRYLLVGMCTTFVSLGVYLALVNTILNPYIHIQLLLANILAWIFSVTFAYLSNRKYVFESTCNNIILEAILFYITRISTLLMDVIIMYIGVIVLGINDKIIKLLVQILVLVINYIGSKVIVFNKI